ncbi:DUF1854 domain-containing protein [bacterium]|nr:DUF1854 domain-containing protein [bacterium]
MQKLMTTTLNTILVEKEMNSKSETKSDSPLKLERRVDGQVWLSRNGSETLVQVTPCFPWSCPDKYISMRDDEDEEIALVEELSVLDKESQSIVHSALMEAGFIMTIKRVLATREDFEIRTWEVETEQGYRRFQTKLEDWPRGVPGGGIIIKDVGGDLFYIKDPDALDEKSRKQIWAFVG